MADAEVLSMIKSCVVSRKGGVPINEINDEYKELVGEAIPFQKFGFKNLEEYLKSLSGIFISRNQNGVPLLTVNDEKLAHINKLVNKQKVAPQKGRRKKVSRVPAGKMWQQKKKLLNFDKAPMVTLLNENSSISQGKQSSNTIDVNTAPLLQQSKGQQPFVQNSLKVKKSSDDGNVYNLSVAQSTPKQCNSTSLHKKEQVTRKIDTLSSGRYHQGKEQNGKSPSKNAEFQSDGRSVDYSASGDYYWKKEHNTSLQHGVARHPMLKGLNGEKNMKLLHKSEWGSQLDSDNRTSETESVNSCQDKKHKMKMVHRGTTHQSEYFECRREDSFLNEKLCQYVEQNKKSSHKNRLFPKKNSKNAAKEKECVVDHLYSYDCTEEESELEVTIQNNNREVRIVGNTLKMKVPNVPDPSCHVFIDFKKSENLICSEMFKPIYAYHQLIGDDYFLHFAYRSLKERCERRYGNIYRCGMCISGQTIWNCRERVMRSNSMANNILLLLGTADILTDMPLSDMKNDMIALLEILESRVKSVVILTIPPLVDLDLTSHLNRRIISFNIWLKHLHTGVRFHVFDIWPLYISIHQEINYNYYERYFERMFGCNEDIILLNSLGRDVLMTCISNGLSCMT